MSIHCTPTGNWFVKHYVNQKEKRKYFGRGNDAKQKAIDYNILLGLGKHRKAKGLVFGELVVDYMKTKKGIISDLYSYGSVLQIQKEHIAIFWRYVCNHHITGKS